MWLKTLTATLWLALESILGANNVTVPWSRPNRHEFKNQTRDQVNKYLPCFIMFLPHRPSILRPRRFVSLAFCHFGFRFVEVVGQLPKLHCFANRYIKTKTDAVFFSPQAGLPRTYTPSNNQILDTIPLDLRHGQSRSKIRQQARVEGDYC